MDIEFYALRIFCQVMRDKTFSKAGRSLGLTQPTVSQQISKLEHALGDKLFERVGHEVIPTRAAKELDRFGRGILEQVGEFSERMHRGRTLPSGKVCYAMPESCQWTPHFKKIMSRVPGLPDIRFEIGILPNDRILKDLLEGVLDFGFVVGEKPPADLKFERFADERYSMVASEKGLFKPLSAAVESGGSRLEGFRWIAFPGADRYLETWARAHGMLKPLKQALMAPTISVGTLAGAIHAAKEGAGAAVIPTHCVATELSERSLVAWSGKARTEVSSPIYLVQRAQSRVPWRVEVVIDLIRQAKLGD